MTAGRIDPFANINQRPAFEVKPKKPEPAVKQAKQVGEQIAAANNFPSRQATKPTREQRARRVYTTGRNCQFNVKAKQDTIDRFYRLADERRVPLGELLEQALEALEARPKPAKPLKASLNATNEDRLELE